MKEINVTIQNEYGLHARPSSLLATLASNFKSDIKIIKDGIEVNCKSIMNLLLLAAGKGTVLRIVADGEDEEEALKAIRELIEVSKFDED
ncbi:MAG: HPr family phosphocarrier protein [Brevinematales bacterium]|nr:HPr family phosphocarrier protein [Brevinematales bacterium]